jgi:hypothetical protein
MNVLTSINANLDKAPSIQLLLEEEDVHITVMPD